MQKKISATVDFFHNQKISSLPKGMIILGSGWSALADYGTTIQEWAFDDIPQFPNLKVSGHQSKWVIQEISGEKILLQCGRKHYYEREGWLPIIFPIMVAAKLGIEWLIVTNAAGSLNQNITPGNLLLIKDHIDSTFSQYTGKIFSYLAYCKDTNYYSEYLNSLFLNKAKENNIDLRTGIYVYVPGPFFETNQEVKILHKWGGTVVGMSTVPEVLAAKALGLPVVGISCVTNFATGVTSKKVAHKEVKKQAQKTMPVFFNLLETILPEINSRIVSN